MNYVAGLDEYLTILGSIASLLKFISLPFHTILASWLPSLSKTDLTMPVHTSHHICQLQISLILNKEFQSFRVLCGSKINLLSHFKGVYETYLNHS